MELEFATLEDIAEELIRRENVKFALLAFEKVGPRSSDPVCLAGKGVNRREISELFWMGGEMFATEDDDQ